MPSTLRLAVSNPDELTGSPRSIGPVNAVETMLLDKGQLSCELRCSKRKIDRLDAAGKLPASLRLGNSKRWARQTIEKWIAAGCPDRRDFDRLTR